MKTNIHAPNGMMSCLPMAAIMLLEWIGLRWFLKSRIQAPYEEGKYSWAVLNAGRILTSWFVYIHMNNILFCFSEGVQLGTVRDSLISNRCFYSSELLIFALQLQRFPLPINITMFIFFSPKYLFFYINIKWLLVMLNWRLGGKFFKKRPVKSCTGIMYDIFESYS